MDDLGLRLVVRQEHFAEGSKNVQPCQSHRQLRHSFGDGTVKQGIRAVFAGSLARTQSRTKGGDQSPRIALRLEQRTQHICLCCTPLLTHIQQFDPTCFLF